METGTETSSSVSVIHRLFGSELRYLTKNGLLLLSGEVATAFAALALGYAFANLLPKETFGQYKYLLSLVSILGAFCLSGLAVALARSAARGYDAALRRVFSVHLLSHGPMAIATLAIAGYYYLHGNLTYAAGLTVAALAQPLINSAMLCLPFLQSKEQYGRASLYTVLFSVIPAALLVGALAITDSLLAVLCTYFASNAAVALALYYLTARRYPADAPADQSLMRYGVHVSLQQTPCCTDRFGGRRGAAPLHDPWMPIVPFKANAARRHRIPKQRHKVTNWAAYDAALRRRGSLTVRFTEEAIAAWPGARCPGPPRAGSPGTRPWRS